MLQIAAEMSTHAVEIVTGCTTHPGDAHPADIVARAVDGGARVCTLHCSVGDVDADDSVPPACRFDGDATPALRRRPQCGPQS
jgi:hypothetical protein